MDYGGMSCATYYRRKAAVKRQQLSENTATDPSATSAPICTIEKPRKIYSCHLCDQQVAGSGHGRYNGKQYCPNTAGVTKEVWLLQQKKAAELNTAAQKETAEPNIKIQSLSANIIAHPLVGASYVQQHNRQLYLPVSATLPSFASSACNSRPANMILPSQGAQPTAWQAFTATTRTAHCFSNIVPQQQLATMCIVGLTSGSSIQLSAVNQGSRERPIIPLVKPPSVASQANKQQLIAPIVSQPSLVSQANRRLITPLVRLPSVVSQANRPQLIVPLVSEPSVVNLTNSQRLIMPLVSLAPTGSKSSI